MKVLVLYRPKSDHARRTEEFVEDIKRQHDLKLDVIDIDSKDGLAVASLYDVEMYPAILVTSIDGQLVKLWAGDEVPPLANEVTSYIFG